MTAATLPTLVALVLTVLALGRGVHRRLLPDGGDPVERLLCWSAAGLLAVGASVLVLGHVRLLTPVGVWSLLTVGSLLAVRQRTALADGVVHAARALRPRGRSGQAVLLLLALCTAMLVVNALRPPTAVDELAYHWASPQLWASQGRWVDSPFRLSDSFALTEVLYTLAAVSGGHVLAHVIHILFFFGLLLAVAVIARATQVPTSLAVGGVATMPVVLNQASIAYNDVAAAAFGVAAVGLVLSGDLSRRRLFMAGLLGAGAVSTKSLLAVLGPVLIAVLVLRAVQRRDRVDWRALVPQGAVIAAPMLAAAGFWLVRSLWLTGRAQDVEGVYLARTADDPLFLNGIAAGRVPDLSDLVHLPLVPFITGIVGQSEPYGGRTGLALLVGLPLLVVALLRADAPLRRSASLLLVPSLTYFLLLSPFLVKTRFNITAYVLLTVAACLGVSWAAGLRGSRWRATTTWGFIGALYVSGLVDSGRIVLQL